MTLIRNPNPWSCLLASAAMVLDFEISELVEMIGHDGSEIVFPDLPEPGRRKGFHLQEIIPIAIHGGYAVTPIEPAPCSTPDGINVFDIKFKDAENRLKYQMLNTRGILTGKVTRWRHAVAWINGLIYDPMGKIDTYNETPLQIDTYWRFDKIKSV